MSVRETVLQALKDSKGQWVSGEALSEVLGVSRTTVWKQVRKLVSDGYEIESSSKKGYRLRVPADLLSPQEVLEGLSTQQFGQNHYFYYQELDSTNNRARELAAEGYPEGTVVAAEMQTAGRGRRGRDWYSPNQEGIYVSVILRPLLPLKEISRVSLLTAVAVAETLATDLNLHPLIKWPNDILINNRKIAGILSEVVTDMDSIEYIVVGIGLNINNFPPDFPHDFRTPATSVQAECQRPLPRVQILQNLLFNLENHYQKLLQGRFGDTLEKAKNLSMVIGREVKIDTLNGFLTGQAVDIDDHGFLLVRDQSGTIHTVMSGEISLLSSPSN
ncbi:Biotin--acetyl-CoA-carboxylase ligase [Syntrophomonas zehnderi OL-4]|uniref:Bifunctional ligase/repressor BirA n=1 Tax=Syntrophomonas zehnderi OL-4 TaxID=690567 RepID=A0A0E4GBX3_9FIRM|nr:biotin--[acetyl-CoA-carboxylase] ligase [Syntrophomonas zehnderi]CFX85196.1 Biotin--acetyl-CoA-carboxylase ligase [Syntrophomonas zehnderi OL-4]